MFEPQLKFRLLLLVFVMVMFTLPDELRFRKYLNKSRWIEVRKVYK